MNKYETRHYDSPPAEGAPFACPRQATTTPLAPYVATEPMLLPWLARKAGIEDVFIRAIWRKAESHARHHAAFGSADYFRLAVERLLSCLSELARSRKSTPYWLQMGAFTGADSRPDAIIGHPHYVKVPATVQTRNLWRPELSPRHGGSR